MLNKQVLIVDDCKIIQRLTSHILADMGINITLASNGLEALEKLKLDPPDLVLLDIIMPEMNGYQVCRQIKSDSTTKNIPIIFCSNKSGEVDLYWAMRQGADGYISKPVKKSELTSIMAKFGIIKNVQYNHNFPLIYKQGIIRVLSPTVG